MRGCRPLTFEEAAAVLKTVRELQCKPVAERNYTMCLVMLSTGLRIGECRMLRVQDVSTDGAVGEHAYLESRYAKTRQGGNAIALSPEAQEAIRDWLEYSGLTEADVWLFPATVGGSGMTCRFKRDDEGRLMPVDHRTVRKALARVKHHLRLTGKFSTHSWRKTFAGRVYQYTGHNHLVTQKALRHSRLESTICYLSADEEEAHDAIMNVMKVGRPVSVDPLPKFYVDLPRDSWESLRGIDWSNPVADRFTFKRQEE